ncbi:hypothetical protein I317_01423 [Kwoniella heveanensis CBS 569]|nr:hypothetical protein I317_01423 [Kwoniella heveanensis CBS 569]
MSSAPTTAADAHRLLDDTSRATSDADFASRRNLPMERLSEMVPGEDDRIYLEDISKYLAEGLVNTTAIACIKVTRRDTTNEDRYGLDLAVPKALVPRRADDTDASALNRLAGTVGNAITSGIIARACNGFPQRSDGSAATLLSSNIDEQINPTVCSDAILGKTPMEAYHASRDACRNEQVDKTNDAISTARDRSSAPATDAVRIPASITPSSLVESLDTIKQYGEIQSRKADERRLRYPSTSFRPLFGQPQSIADFTNPDDPRKKKRAATDSKISQAFERSSTSDLTDALFYGSAPNTDGNSKFVDLNDIKLSTYEMSGYPTAADFAPTAADAEEMITRGASMATRS